MLQLRVPGLDAGRALETRADLAAQIDEALLLHRESRARWAAEQALPTRLDERIDAWLRTEELEHLDEPDFPEREKVRIAQGVRLMNTLTFSSRRFLTVLRPALEEIAAREGRPARVLEIAGGTGGFAMALAELTQKANLSVEVHGSDIVPAYVERARTEAAARGLSVPFHLLDATRMEVEDGAYDVVFVAQSMHHFSPGRLGELIAEAGRVARHSFVGIDGYRSLAMVAFVTGSAAFSLHPASMHDAWITARRFYSHAELEHIARLAAPDAAVRTRRTFINTVLEVDFRGAS